MLQQFGFTQYESQVYTSLITVNQPLDATAIVKRSSVPRSKVYEVLQRLSDKGMILEATVEKKRLYTALPLESVIEKLKADFEENIEQLKKIEVEDIPLDDRIWSLKENQSIQSLIKELTEGAERSIYLSAWGDDLNQFLPILEEKDQQGLDVHIHAIGEIETSIKAVSTLIPDQHHNTLERSRILIVDQREMLFAGIEESSWQAIRTQSPPLVKFFTEFFYHDVALTKITKRYKETIMRDEEIKDILLKLRY
ncbi:TrmB family transcriptional regulator [Alkalihalophilus marmarensis]|uniref:TrmB family transcriptional regulator n=1 Tax=Alkalihalophilus marmarensis TaxID=521377 RepID=UPI002040723F|nr:TrmB family transcriptional regulator [Alkalihalophilus marmarensis]MCM3491086.1 TrmB family transcriptional regulator [Alkalihalophilus marmarensis]